MKIQQLWFFVHFCRFICKICEWIALFVKIKYYWDIISKHRRFYTVQNFWAVVYRHKNSSLSFLLTLLISHVLSFSCLRTMVVTQRSKSITILHFKWMFSVYYTPLFYDSLSFKSSVFYQRQLPSLQTWFSVISQNRKSKWADIFIYLFILTRLHNFRSSSW